MSTRAKFFQSMYPGLSDGEVIDELIKASIYVEHGPEVVTISAAEGIHYVHYDAEMQKKAPYWEGAYEACNIPFTDFQIRYQPEQIRIVDGKRILEDTAFLCRKDNDHFLILPSIYEKLDLDDWLLAHLFFYDKDGKRCIGVWCCTIKVDIGNSKSQYIEKDKQEATKDGSESTKIQHGI